MSVAELKPAYLVCGDDDAKIDAWRARVRRRAEEERGPGGLETFDARESEPAEVAGGRGGRTHKPTPPNRRGDEARPPETAHRAPREG